MNFMPTDLFFVRKSETLTRTNIRMAQAWRSMSRWESSNILSFQSCHLSNPTSKLNKISSRVQNHSQNYHDIFGKTSPVIICPTIFVQISGVIATHSVFWVTLSSTGLLILQHVIFHTFLSLAHNGKKSPRLEITNVTSLSRERRNIIKRTKTTGNKAGITLSDPVMGYDPLYGCVGEF